MIWSRPQGLNFVVTVFVQHGFHVAPFIEHRAKTQNSALARETHEMWATWMRRVLDGTRYDQDVQAPDQVRAALEIDRDPLLVWPGTAEALRELKEEFDLYMAQDSRHAIEHFRVASAQAWHAISREDAEANHRVLFADYPVLVVDRVAPTDVIVGLPMDATASEVTNRLLPVLL